MRARGGSQDEGQAAQIRGKRWRIADILLHLRSVEVVRRVALGTWNDGFIHAGNLAYMALLAIFPFFIIGSAFLSAFGDADDKSAAIDAVQTALPPSVGNVIVPAARDAVAARTGWLLWVGSLIAIWTVSSLIETIRDILRRAYQAESTASFWRRRLFAAGIIMLAMVALLASLVGQLLIGTAEEMIDAWAPQLVTALHGLALSRVLPALVAYGAIYLLFLMLTPPAFRAPHYPKWPGALAVALWWVAVSVAFPPLLRSMFNYSLTYGGLAGMIIALFFFWLIGLGIVVGAELNAALAYFGDRPAGGAGNAEEKAR